MCTLYIVYLRKFYDPFIRVICVHGVILLPQQSKDTMATASTSIEIPYLRKGMLVKDWKKGFLAATALLEEKQRIAIMPLYVNRNLGDQKWS